MSVCEKCWSDAYLRVLALGGELPDHYHDLLVERRNNPCTTEQQSGNFNKPPSIGVEPEEKK